MRVVANFVALLSFVSPCAAAASHAYVVDTRLSVLRSSPDLASSALRRIGVGRPVVVVARRRDRYGLLWLRVAVTRRTRGWMLDGALATPRDPNGERRLAERLASTTGLARVRLARLTIDRFPALRCDGVRAAEAASADVAARATQTARRKLGTTDGLDPTTLRALMLSDPMLDAYSKLGVVFDLDPAAGTLVVRGIGSSWRSPRRGARLSFSSEGVGVRRCNQ